MNQERFRGVPHPCAARVGESGLRKIPGRQLMQTREGEAGAFVMVGNLTQGQKMLFFTPGICARTTLAHSFAARMNGAPRDNIWTLFSYTAPREIVWGTRRCLRFLTPRPRGLVPN
jgi:hypothetical protein